MTRRELAQAEALNRCSLVPGSWDKRFIRSMPPASDAITERQAEWLDALAWKYRRQMPVDLVPAKKPETRATPHEQPHPDGPDGPAGREP